MKNNKLKIYLVVALLLIIGVGYAFLNQNIELDNSVTVKGYDKPGVPMPSAITIVSGEKGNLQPGDEIKIGDTESFYVVSSDSTKTILMTKYCLGTSGNQVSDTTYQKNKFSESAYWDNNGLIAPYNENGASYTGNPYPYVYDTNSSIYNFINGNDGYVEKLKTMGAPSTITGRLLKYEEANSLTVAQRTITDQIYWIGSAYDGTHMWYMDSAGTLANTNDYNETYGIRPVIEINTSDI